MSPASCSEAFPFGAAPTRIADGGCSLRRLRPAAAVFRTGAVVRVARSRHRCLCVPLSAPLPRYITTFDLLVNVLAYVPLGALIVLALYPKMRGLAAAAVAAAGGLLLSGTIEAGQTFLPSRIPSNLDLLTNTVGALAGALLTSPFAASLIDRGRLVDWRRRWFEHDTTVGADRPGVVAGGADLPGTDAVRQWRPTRQPRAAGRGARGPLVAVRRRAIRSSRVRTGRGVRRRGRPAGDRARAVFGAATQGASVPAAGSAASCQPHREIGRQCGAVRDRNARWRGSRRVPSAAWHWECCPWLPPPAERVPGRRDWPGSRCSCCCSLSMHRSGEPVSPCATAGVAPGPTAEFQRDWRAGCPHCGRWRWEQASRCAVRVRRLSGRLPIICVLTFQHMSHYKHHVFFCLNEREDGAACCGRHQASEMQQHAK